MEAQQRGGEVGAVWTYEDIVAVRGKPPPAVPPGHWPDGVRVDTAKRVHWLPEGFGQGIRTTRGGKSARCYISPGGELHHDKRTVAKALGRELPSRRSGGGGGGGRVSGLDRVPRWDDRLPKDWRLAFRRAPSGKLRKIFVMPGEDRFLWFARDVEEYLAGSGRYRGIPLCGRQQHARPSSRKDETPAARRRSAALSDIELTPGEPQPKRRCCPAHGPGSSSGGAIV